MRPVRLARWRELTSASSHRWLGDGIEGLAEPFSVAGWIRKSGTPPTGYAVFSADTAGGTSRWQISVNATNVLTALAVNTAATAGTATGATVTDLALTHVGAVFASSSSRTAYTNGVAGSPNTTPITVSGVDSLRIGARVASGVEALFFNGQLGPLAVWRGALSAHEMRLLSLGRSPFLVRPFDLLSLIGMDAPTNDLYDLVRRRRLAASGRPAIQLFPRNLLDPGRDPLFAVAALTPPGSAFVPAWARNANTIIGIAA